MLPLRATSTQSSRAASRYVGTSRSPAHWPSHTSTEHLTRQVQQQSWQPLAKRTNMLILAPVISLSPLPLRPWEFSMHQLASFWLILEEESQLILARLERPVICFRGFLLWCSPSTLFCCTTVCWPLTARTDDRTHLCTAESICRLPRKWSTETKK